MHRLPFLSTPRAVRQVGALVLGLAALAGGLLAQTRPFPQNINYGQGFKPTTYTSTDLQTDFNEWKADYVINVGTTMQRVAFDQPGGAYRHQTVSEGQAYGMLIAAYMGDRTLFDKLLAFYEKWQFKNTTGWHGAPDGLMSWKVSETGPADYADSSPATDADEDAILALLVAYEQWGATAYKTKALQYLTILKWYVQPTGVGNRVYLKPGNWGPGTDCAPDYHAPAWYRVFADYSGEAIWTQLATDTYHLFDLHSAFWDVNLVSDFCDASDGGPGKSDGNGADFASDACRAPWRLGMDYLWYGNTRARDYSIRFADFATSQNYDIRAYYPYPNATPPGWNQGAESDGAFAVAAMAKSQSVLNSQTTAFKEAWQIGYYPKTLRVIYGLALTGNFWRPTYGLGTTPPPTGGTPVVIDSSSSTKFSTNTGWWSLGVTGAQGGTAYTTANKANNIATYTPGLTGSHKIEAYIPSGWSRASTVTTYTIAHAGGTATATVNAVTSAGTWVQLGTTNFTLTTASTVKLRGSCTQDADPTEERVLADALRFTPATTTPPTNPPPANTEVLALQAEDSGNLLTGVNVLTTRSGFSGTGYVGNFDTDTDALTFRFNLAQAQTLKLVLRVAAPYGPKETKVSVNGAANVTVALTSNANWTEITVGTYSFPAGANSVKISSHWGWYEIDTLYLRN